MKVTAKETEVALAEGLARSGLRPTSQRSAVYDVLVSSRDHPTAEEVFLRSRKILRTISLATVYNCLETLVDCGLVRAVHRDRLPTRYCANRCEHAHFHDESGEVTDVPLSPDAVKYIAALIPEGFAADSFELSYRGHAPRKTGSSI
jgi:Fur family peroxide stress response transcriptional regulator